MQSTVEKLGNHQIKLTIQVDKDTFLDATQKAYRSAAGRFAIPGFRRGKAPRRVIENHYGDAIFYEDAVNILLPDVYKDAVEEHDLDPVDQPKIDIEQIGADQDLILSMMVLVKPEIELGEYKGLSAKRFAASVSDEQLEEQINQARDRAARWVDVDRPVQTGDQILMDFSGSVDGEKFPGGASTNYTLEVGSGSFIPGFEEQLVGMAKNEEKTITVTFPEDYRATELAGKEAQFDVLVHEIKEKELPELDDEFAKDVSEFDSFLEYKQDLRKKLLDRARREADQLEENDLLEKLLAGHEMEVPEPMIEDRITDLLNEMAYRLAMQGLSFEQFLQYTNQTVEDLRKQRRADAERNVKLDLLLEAIAKAENLAYDEEEYQKVLQSEAEVAKVTPEEFEQKYIGTVKKMKESLRAQKALAFLKDNAKWEAID